MCCRPPRVAIAGANCGKTFLESAPTVAFRESHDVDGGTQRDIIENESVEGRCQCLPHALADGPASAGVRATQHFRKGERDRCATMHTQPLNDEQCLE